MAEAKMPKKSANKTVEEKQEETLEKKYDAIPDDKVEKNCYGRVTAEMLNVRTKTSKEHGKIIAVINKGTRVMILEKLPGWYKIKYADKVGFCMKDFITEE